MEYVYLLNDIQGNNFGVLDGKLALDILLDNNNPFDCLSRIEKNEFDGDILKSINEFNNYFY